MNKLYLFLTFLSVSGIITAQKVQCYTSTDNDFWKESEIRMSRTPLTEPALTINGNEKGSVFKSWGTTFNELDWDALLMLTRDEQDEIMRNLFAPDGDLRFTRGRIGMNCNDYGRSWWSCDEVQGDLELRYFNIDRDKRSIIPLIRAAQKYNPDLTFWASPWSPPSWMKVNNDYPVVSSKHNNADPKIDYLLFGSIDAIDEDEMKFLGERNGQFPRKLATQDYFIQDPRYLQAYANYFCKFIDAYKEQGVPIDMMIYQNEAYSYTPYPGCAWTAEGTVRFNRDYLSPTLRQKHPDVKLYLGTFNTNRQDHVEKILSDEGLRESIDGLAFQWEGREILPAIRQQYPRYSYICSESECGNGSMDWKAGEHTFFLINDNLGKGCDEWYNWNFLLPKEGMSPWGWKQNALIELDPTTRSFRYTPEYYAVKHFSNLLKPGAEIIGFSPKEKEQMPLLIARNPNGEILVIVSNFNDEPKPISVKLNNRYLNATLKAHSFNSFVISK
ncbi:MAG: beta-glycosidase [Muribaculaceae bacterium]|nr:beta-glycosidase [Muribaculaceae bacterium]